MSDSNSTNSLAPAQRLLLAVQGVFLLALGLSSTFINTFIWNYNNRISFLNLYYIPSFLFTGIGGIACSYMAKKLNLVRAMRAGIVFYALSYGMLLAFGGFIAKHPWILGTTNGISAGFFYIAFNAVVSDYSKENPDIFFSRQGIVVSICSLVAPLTAGAIIDALPSMTGYIVVFSSSLTLFLFALFMTRRLTPVKSTSRLYYKSIIALHFKDASVLKAFVSEIVRGIREGAMFFLLTMLIYNQLPSELLVGTYSFATSLVAVGAYIVLGRVAKKENRKKLILLGALSITALSIVPFFSQNAAVLFIFGCALTFFTPFIMNNFTSVVYTVVNNIVNVKRRRIEFFAVRENYINMGRTLGVIPLFFIPETEFSFSVFFTLLAISQIFIWVVLRNVEQ